MRVYSECYHLCNYIFNFSIEPDNHLAGLIGDYHWWTALVRIPFARDTGESKNKISLPNAQFIRLEVSLFGIFFDFLINRF